MALTTYMWSRVAEAFGNVRNNYCLIFPVILYVILAIVLTPVFIIVDIITCCSVKTGPF
jgi:hypothetical protein